MVFAVFTALVFIVLRLSLRGRFGAFVLLPIVVGLAADLAIDLLVPARQ